jgi:hypothetical protein
MPSPFPGMDPYLESPDIWPDLHHRLASIISSALNRMLPRPFYARVEMRPELAIVTEEGEGRSRIIPDVLILRHADSSSVHGGTAVLDPPQREISRWVEFKLCDEIGQHYFVEIRDSARNHKLITLIEILSPSNKRPGPDRDAYQAKQHEVLASDASLVEIDLLRAGRRILPTEGLTSSVSRLQPRPDYLVFVSPAWRRSTIDSGYRAFPFSLREPLPCIEIPLREEIPNIALDLQGVFHRAYDDGPYQRGAVDYTKPADPPLSEDDSAWADGRLTESGLRPAS